MKDPRLVKAKDLPCSTCTRLGIDFNGHNLSFEGEVVCGYCGRQYPQQQECEGVPIPEAVGSALRSLLHHGLFQLWHDVLLDKETSYIHLERFEHCTVMSTCRIEWCAIGSDADREATPSSRPYARRSIRSFVVEHVHQTAKLLSEQGLSFTQADVAGDSKSLRFQRFARVSESTAPVNNLRIRAQIDWCVPKQELHALFVPVAEEALALAILKDGFDWLGSDMLRRLRVCPDRTVSEAELKKQEGRDRYLLKFECNPYAAGCAILLDLMYRPPFTFVNEPVDLQDVLAHFRGRHQSFAIGEHLKEVLCCLDRSSVTLELLPK
ncbi:MAG TPA: hypothetical protein V6C81_26830 [Planktothrix sp.]